MLGAAVLHLGGDLDNKSPAIRAFGDAEKTGIVEFVAVVVGMKADAGHAVDFVAAPQILLPIGQSRIHTSKGQP